MRRALVGVVAGSLLSCAVMAQQPAAESTKAQTVLIRVVDPTGAAVPEAHVRVTPKPQTLEVTAETNSSGKAELQLLPGEYTLAVSLGGFKTYSTQVTVKVAGAQGVGVALELPRDDRIIIKGPLGAPEKDALEIVSPLGSHTVKLRDLWTLARKTVVVHDPDVNTDEKYEGVELAELLRWYGAPVGKELRGSALTYYVVAGGSDGYKAVFSLAEIDPSFHPGYVIVADTMDSKPLDARSGSFRLVVTEDKRPARGVRNLVSLEVKEAK